MISIVVPVYNGEKFIEKNFLSLVNQDNNTFEVIYINDGSIDNTAEKIEILIKNYSNFRLISTPNSGVMAARKQGVEVAKYDFVTFLDIDDVLDSNFVSVFLNYCKDNKFEILVTNFRLNKNNNLKDIVRFQPGIYSSSDFIKYLCVNGGWELCGKVYKKELFDNIIYPNKVTIGEDALIFFQLVFYAYEIKVLNEYVYTYIYHDSSASNVRDYQKCQDGILSAIFIRDFLERKTSIEIKYLNSLILLFYSNSLTRGILKRNDPLVNNIWQSFNLESLFLLPFEKQIFILIGLVLTKLNFKS